MQLNGSVVARACMARERGGRINGEGSVRQAGRRPGPIELNVRRAARRRRGAVGGAVQCVAGEQSRRSVSRRTRAPSPCPCQCAAAPARGCEVEQAGPRHADRRQHTAGGSGVAFAAARVAVRTRRGGGRERQLERGVPVPVRALRCMGRRAEWGSIASSHACILLPGTPRPHLSVRPG